MSLEESSSIQSPIVVQFKGLIESFFMLRGQEPLHILTVDEHTKKNL